MKKMLSGWLLLWAVLWGSGLHAGDLHWEKDLNSAFSKASAENRPLMVMVETRNCRWCKKMKEKTLKDKAVSRRLQRFILVRVDRDTISSRYVPYAKYVPTIYFMTPRKKIVESVTGYFDIADFKSWIDDVEKKL